MPPTLPMWSYWTSSPASSGRVRRGIRRQKSDEKKYGYFHFNDSSIELRPQTSRQRVRGIRAGHAVIRARIPCRTPNVPAVHATGTVTFVICRRVIMGAIRQHAGELVAAPKVRLPV